MITSRLVAAHAAFGQGIEVVEVTTAIAGERALPASPRNQLALPSPLKVSLALEPIAPSMLISLSVSLPRFALSVARLRSTTTAALPPNSAKSVPLPPFF